MCQTCVQRQDTVATIRHHLDQLPLDTLQVVLRLLTAASRAPRHELIDAVLTFEGRLLHNFAHADSPHSDGRTTQQIEDGVHYDGHHDAPRGDLADDAFWHIDPTHTDGFGG